MRVSLIMLSTSLLSVGAYAHHSQSPFFDQSKDIEIEGIVQRWDFRNPHAVLYIEVANNTGSDDLWAVQFSSLAVLIRSGIDADAFLSGEKVSVVGHPAWNENAHGIGSPAVTKQGGRQYVDPLRSGNFTPGSATSR